VRYVLFVYLILEFLPKFCLCCGNGVNFGKFFRGVSIESAGSGGTSVLADVGGRTKLRKRLGAALSKVDFEHCDPQTCVSVLRVASIQVILY